MSYGDIVLANSKKGFIAQAIKWFTGSKFSHCLITAPDCLERPMGFEAAETGVSSVPFDKNYTQNDTQGYEIWEVLISEEDKNKGINRIIDELETPYGVLQYPWFIWRRLNYLFGRDIKSQDNWVPRAIVCSILTEHYLQGCGLCWLFKDYGKGSVTPQDVRNVMVAHPELFRLKEVKE